ncbi:MAG: hypothetical protein JWQ20_4569 [Conexibacter sp.]|nr:hypothetical protein [Conexibacter sp.]
MRQPTFNHAHSITPSRADRSTVHPDLEGTHPGPIRTPEEPGGTSSGPTRDLFRTRFPTPITPTQNR